MADNVQLPVTGTGTADVVVATDQLAGGEHAQFVKIMDGTLGESVKLDVVVEDVASAGAESGILAMAVRKDTPANQSGTDGDFEYLQVSSGRLWTSNLGFPVTVQTDVTRPANTTAYAINDAVADTTPTAGGFTFTSAARKSGGSGIITDACVSFEEDAATPLVGEIFIFNQAVTAITDNAAFAITDAEAKTCIGVIPFSLIDIGNNGYAHISNLNYLFTCVGTANLRFLIRAKNAYAPTTNSSILTFTLKIIQID